VYFDTAVGPVDPLREMSGEALLLEYRSSGDRGLFAELIYRFGPGLYTYLCEYLGDTAVAEDVFQETFHHVHGKREEFEKGDRLRPWLYEIATRQAIATRQGDRHQ
jgi:RNA polymerase sigma-70 factor (ECF subfamily)